MGPDVLAALRRVPGASPLLDALSAVAGVQVVGGAVRDVLLGREPSEVDLVVVGDAPALARRLAGATGAGLRVHERFGTATISLGPSTFDLASARRESYPRPGALPEVVEGASLPEDLERRDFTVNAIAVEIATSRVTAHPAALGDLKARRLRVLHDGSFRDDPTRLLRLCRYAGRLSFAIEPGTGELAAAALRTGAMATVSGDRIGRELRLAAGDAQPAVSLVLSGTGVGAAVLGGFDADPDLLTRALALCPPDGRRELVLLSVVARNEDPASVAARLAALGFTRDEVDRVGRSLRAAPRLARLLADPGSEAPSRIASQLAAEPVEAVALAGALAGTPVAIEVVRRWLDEQRHVRPLLDGRDLAAAGLRGAGIGRGLRAALAVALDDPGAGRDAQMEAALAAGGAEPGE